MSVLVDDRRLSAVYVTNDRSHGVRASCRACDTGGLVSNSTAFSTQPAFQLVRDGLNRGLLAQGAFPDGRDSPARLQQVVAVRSVPFDVRIELGLPEFPARARCRRVRAAGVPVPEAAVHEAYGTESTKHEVRCPRKSAVVQTESKTAGMDGSTQGEFGPSVPASDPRHHARTSRATHDVRHRRCRALLGGDRPATGYTRGSAYSATRRDTAATCRPALACAPVVATVPRWTGAVRDAASLRRRELAPGRRRATSRNRRRPRGPQPAPEAPPVSGPPRRRRDDGASTGHGAIHSVRRDEQRRLMSPEPRDYLDPERQHATNKSRALARSTGRGGGVETRTAAGTGVVHRASFPTRENRRGDDH